MSLDALLIALAKFCIESYAKQHHVSDLSLEPGRTTMTNKLSRLEGTNVEDLRQISFAMQEYLTSESENSLQIAIEKINQRPGLIAKLFPTPYLVEQQKITLQRMRSIARSREELFKLYTEVQLEIAKKQSDALVASVGMQLQASLAAFAAERIDEITATIVDSRQKFMSRIKHQLEELESYKSFPQLYEPAQKSVNQEIGIYFDSIGKLLTGFVATLESRVASSRR